MTENADTSGMKRRRYGFSLKAFNRLSVKVEGNPIALLKSENGMSRDPQSTCLLGYLKTSAQPILISACYTTYLLNRPVKTTQAEVFFIFGL
jgi:hypothetical protein